MDSQFVSVVVPVMNERDNARPLLQELQDALADVPCEFVFVDDGSTDGTRSQLETLAEEEPRLKAVFLRRNFGQSAAMLAGIEHASGNVIVTMDGDRQNDPADVPRMLRQLRFGYDLVHGWRKQRRDGWILRRLPSMIANRIIRSVTDCPVHDLGCALKVMRREIADDLQLYGDMHRFIAVLARNRGARCLEMEVHHRPRVAGVAKYGLSRTLRVMLDLITVRYLQEFSTKPMRLFGRLAVFSGLLGGLMLAGCVTRAWHGQAWLGPEVALPTAAVLALSAVNCLGLGLLGETVARVFYQKQGRRPYTVQVVHHAAARQSELRMRDAAGY